MDRTTIHIFGGTDRAIPEPGTYTVSCRFDLTPSWTDRNKLNFNVPVETTYQLTILPREPANVERVLEELFDQSNRTAAVSLKKLIDTIGSFGKDAAVPGLIKMIRDGDVEHRIAAVTGLGKITTPASRQALLTANRNEQPAVRVAAITSLGSFTDPQAVDAVIQALSDPDDSVRTVAAEALGRMKTDAAIKALLEQLPKARPDDAAAILRGMGTSQSPRVFDALVRSLAGGDDTIRRAAIDAITHFPARQAADALRPYTTDGDMNLRETVVRTLAESLKQPIDVEWLVPVIKSRKGANSIGDAPRLLRLYGGHKAVPAILSCLDFENPAVRSYYNMTVVESQLSCLGALAVPWHADLNRDGTPAEIAENRRTLATIKSWLDYCRVHPGAESPRPWDLDREAENKTWGDPLDGVSIRAWVHRSVWPASLPQVVTVNARSHPGEGSLSFSSRPDPLEVEVNSEWYYLPPSATLSVSGEWNAYHGREFEDLQLDSRWRRKSDDQPLDLKAGNYTIRVRLSTAPRDKRTGLVMSRPIEIKVIPTQ